MSALKPAALGLIQNNMLRAGGARNPHVLTCTLRFLRSGDAPDSGRHGASARDGFKSTDSNL
jgi:hypothetical protein